ncbi:hypothetical protein EST38_g163 [Candolleomyces aberdarensis]|uniref:Carbohydrate esterase family 16 protein n=1 Tax=Candolleomyces aberdarensis TaxID=2316362 RepID=A0A4Q2DZB8_9AGAR|nr:hypothetical protein EST38_g163 [Candolleomyces aberdarensis]
MLALQVVLAAVLALTANVLPGVQAAPGGKPTPSKGPNYWFSFGDSYTQTGFNPTGILPTSDNPFGNPPYPGWTSTGGENWVGYLATKYNKSTILTYNYAYGGAVINASLVTPWRPDVLSLTDQVAQFLEGAAKKPATTPWTSKNALFSVFIGINDIGNSWWIDGGETFHGILLDNYFELVQKMYDVGGRNFLFVNVPPIDRSPLMLEQGTESTAGEKVVLANFNARLESRIAAFKKANRGVRTFLYDSVSQYNEILDNPTKFGFRDAVTWGKDADLFWGDNYHPSSYAHKFFGERVAEVLRDTIW